MRHKNHPFSRRPVTLPGTRAQVLLALVIFALPWPVLGQQPGGAAMPTGGPAAGGMPDLRAISGKPLPDRGMPAGTVTVRVVRQTLANAVANAEVTALLEAPGGEMRKRTAKTDAGGRALFESLPVGHQFHAEVVVDGEKLATDTFPIAEVGGVRTMLIAALPAGGGASGAAAESDGAAGAGAADAADADKKQGFTLGFVSGTARPDPTLPLGAVEVLARDEAGNPLAGQMIELGHVRGGGQVEVTRQHTDAQGVTRFTGLLDTKAAGTKGVADIGVAVVMPRGALRLGSDGFGLPAAGGVRVELQVPQRTSDPSVITIGAGGRVILQLRDEALSFIETLPLENHSDKLFDPGAGGVEIRLPREFVNAEGAEGEHKIEIRKGLGVAVHGIIPPRRPQAADPNRKSPDEVTFGFVMPMTGSTREFEQDFAMGMGEFTFVTEQVPGLKIESAQITGRQDRELGGKKYWLMRGEPIPPGGTLRFVVRGLPAPDNTGRIISGALALALAAAAGVFGRRSGTAQKKGVLNEREQLVQRREKLFAELVNVEARQRAAAAAAAGTRETADRSVRGELVQKLEAVYRDLAALDERHAV
ncbi:MAG: hypothetical protein ABIS92_08800 [Polyangia bacterium]